MSFTKKVLFGLLSGVLLLLAFSTLSGRQRPAVAAGTSDLRTALPTQAELPSFEKYQATGNGKQINGIVAVRKSDELTFGLDVHVASSEEEATRIIKRATWTQKGPGPMPKTSPTGRKIGQEVYQSYRGGPEPQRQNLIIVRDGLSIIYVRVSIPLQKDSEGLLIYDAKGQPIGKELSQADLKFAEDQAIKALEKLGKMGLTSKKAS